MTDPPRSTGPTTESGTAGPSPGHATLRRTVGLPGAILLGLGSMVGTGVFVSVGLAANVAGPSVVAATVLAALLAGANALSSAQLAASHPVSGGTYEYGRRYLTPTLGFAAGWLFLLAKSASAATAALGIAGYVLDAVGAPAAWRVPAALVATGGLTALVAGGLKRSTAGNALVVLVAIGGLVALVVAAVPDVLAGWDRLRPVLPSAARPGSIDGFLHGAALMFVAFTGYGRLATLGEEVRDPARVIPRAIVWTVSGVAVLYVAVAVTGVTVLGAGRFGAAALDTAAPLEAVARALSHPIPVGLVAVAAVAALAGVLLNLLLGLSRVVLAMARHGDAPRVLARLDHGRSSPVAAVWVCGAFVAGISLAGNVAATWSFSAFTVLVYYAVTNLAALRLPPAARRYPRWIAAAGLAGCLALAFQVDADVWATGGAALLLGMAGRWVARRGAHGGGAG